MTDVRISWTKFLVRVSRTRNLDRLSGALARHPRCYSVRTKRYRIAKCDANWPPCDSKCHMRRTHVRYKRKHRLFDRNTQCQGGWQWIKNAVVRSPF